MVEFTSDEAMEYNEKVFRQCAKSRFLVVASLTLCGHRFPYSISLAAAHVSRHDKRQTTPSHHVLNFVSIPVIV